mgnify:FL=1
MIYHKKISRFKEFFKLLNFLILSIIYFGISTEAYAQCQSNSVVLTQLLNNSNYTFLSNTHYCVSEDVTLNDVIINENVTIYVASGKTLKISNNINESNSNSTLNLEIHGTMTFGQTPQFRSNINLHIESNGNFFGSNNGSGNVTFNGATNTIINKGIIKVGVLGVNGQTTFENSKNVSTLANLNVSGTLLFNNKGNLNIGAQFGFSSSSRFSNCGTIFTQGFNLQGGTIYNTGSFNISDKLDGSGLVNNYGEMNLDKIQGSLKTIENHGRIIVNTNNLSDLELRGPITQNLFGEFIWAGKSSTNNFKVFGNQILKNSSGNSTAIDMFNNQSALMIQQNGDVKWGNCSSCIVDVNSINCINASTGAPIKDDTISPPLKGCVQNRLCDNDFDGDGIPDSIEMLSGGVPSPEDTSGKYLINILYKEDFGKASSINSQSIDLNSIGNNAITAYNYYLAKESPKVSSSNAGASNPNSLQDGYYTVHHNVGNLSNWTIQNGSNVWYNLKDHTSPGLGRMYIVNAGNPTINGNEAVFYKKVITGVKAGQPLFASLWAINLDVSKANRILPNITIYLRQNGIN